MDASCGSLRPPHSSAICQWHAGCIGSSLRRPHTWMRRHRVPHGHGPAGARGHAADAGHVRECADWLVGVARGAFGGGAHFPRGATGARHCRGLRAAVAAESRGSLPGGKLWGIRGVGALPGLCSGVVYRFATPRRVRSLPAWHLARRVWSQLVLFLPRLLDHGNTWRADRGQVRGARYVCSMVWAQKSMPPQRHLRQGAGILHVHL
mmetsp:Transcript_32861/g.47966  ORF Transcript_32861/g.47966 Transcript_32861/m.47966 type:complete len:207 (-) Transcript_32861:1722-2342(-)